MTIRSRVKKRIISVAVAALMISTLSGVTMDIWATTIKDVEQAIEDTENQLEEINGNISDLEDEQDLLDEQMEDLNAEIINILTSIDLLEDDIVQKKADIELTSQAYEAALQKEQDQAEAMALQIRFMYETGDDTLMTMLFSNISFSDMLNRVTYAESVNAYNQEMLNQYEATRKEVRDLWDQLEADKASLEADKAEMEEGWKWYPSGQCRRSGSRGRRSCNPSILRCPCCARCKRWARCCRGATGCQILLHYCHR